MPKKTYLKFVSKIDNHIFIEKHKDATQWYGAYISMQKKKKT